MKKVFKNIAFWAIYDTWYGLSLMPLWLHYLFSDVLFLFMAYVLRYRRRVISKNLRNAYPDKSDKELKKLRMQFYRHFCDILVETVKYTSITDKNIMRRMTFKNSEEVAEILNSGQSIALLLGHYGNWEWVSSLVLWVRPLIRNNTAMGQIYHPLENEVIDRVVLKTRGRMKSDSVSMKETLRWILGNKREGRQQFWATSMTRSPHGTISTTGLLSSIRKLPCLPALSALSIPKTRLPSISMSSAWDAAATIASSRSSHVTRQRWASLN